MEGWKAYKLGDVVQIVKDSFIPNAGNHTPYIGLEHIDQQTLQLSGLGNSSSVTSNKFKFQSGDVLFGKLRPYFRKIYRPKFDGVCSTDIWVMRSKGAIDQRFLFYYVSSSDFINLSTQGSTGTHMPRADWQLLKDIEINLPSLAYQQQVGEILGALDDKIELNRQMNNTLQQIAQELYNHYFVKGIDSENLPEGWRKAKLGDECNIFRGASPRPIIDPKYFSNGTIPWIKIADATAENSIYINKTKEYCTELAVTKSRFLSKGTLIMSNSATIGLPKILNIDGCIHDGWLAFDSFKNITKNYVFFILIQNLKNFDQIATGSVQNNLNTGLLKELQILVPISSILYRFQSQSQEIFDMILSVENEIQLLVETRDTLIPKLISGELIPADLTALEQIL